MSAAAAALLAALDASHAATAPVPATLVVVAHPDDETVGAGSRLPRLAAAHFVYVTDGAPRDGADAARHGLTPAAYAQARSRELAAVLALCGIGAERIVQLGCADQQAALQLAPLAERLAQLFLRYDTRVVLTHAYEGGHPDHDATAFIVHAAAALLRARSEPAPELVEMAGYRLGPQGTLLCEFLPDEAADSHAVHVPLGPEPLAFKQELIAAFTTQRETLSWLPIAVERFRPAPRYDFTQPPHAGMLNYERFPWGMTGERFRALAAEALAQLRLEGPL
jgi:LmbE family N-acetylglucosaminyl deacetylase